MNDIQLEGLVIDWHLAEYDYSVELPIGDDQPAYVFYISSGLSNNQCKIS